MPPAVMEKGKNVMPPQPPVQQPPNYTTSISPWVAEGEKLLLDNGWKRAGINRHNQSMWSDPLGSNEPAKLVDEKDAIVLKAVGGGTTKVRQMVGPVPPWNFPLEEAIAVQRARDAAEKA